VLTEFRLQDGSAVLLGTELWLTPKGRQIWRKGIEPDVHVSLPPDALPFSPEQGATADPQAIEEDVQLQVGLRVLQGHLLPAGMRSRQGCPRCQ